MDILNWLYLAKNKLVRSTVSSTKDLLVFGSKVGFSKRGDLYETYGMTVEDLTAYINQSAIPASLNYGLYASTANSTPINNTITPGSLIGSGVGSLTVPANTFKVGDSFHLKMLGHLSCANNAGFTINVTANGTAILGTTGGLILAACTNKHWELNIYFTIRALGAATVAQIISGGIFSYTKNASDAFQGTNFTELNNTTFDTTILNTLSVTGQWLSLNVANSIYSEVCILNKLY